MNKYYPVNLVLKDKKCLVAGAGKVAERKVRRLLECGAIVSVIGPEITPGLKRLADKKRIVFKRRKAGLKDLTDAYLVISAASDRELNSAISSFCLKKGILINVVDSPLESNFILPSLVKKGDLTITISTDGISPALAKKIRQELEKTLGREYIGFLRIMKKARPLALKKIKAPQSRRSFLQKALQPEIFELLRQNKEKEAREKILKLLLGFARN